MSAPSAAERVLDKLEGVKTQGPHSWTALCPAHGDKNPSLSIREVLTPEGEGRARIHCFAGCGDLEVLQAVGLTVRDLFDNPKGELSYVYNDLDGTLNRSVNRYLKADGSKGFRQSGHQGKPTILYRLPEVVAGVAAGKPVYLLEGEADVDLAFQEGLVATSSPQGASSWQKADYSPLQEAHQIIIVQDKDPAGRKRGSGLYQHLRHQIPAADIHLVEPRVAGDKVDFTDHFMAGFTTEDLVPVHLPEQGGNSAQDAPEPRRRAVLTKASQVRLERPRWALNEFLPLQVLTLIAGYAGEGKSTLALHWAALATRGKLPGEFHGIPRDVVICAAEDSKTMQSARLKAAGADLDRVHFLDVAIGEEQGADGQIIFPRDIDIFRGALEKVHPLIVIFDPITTTITGDQWKAATVREALTPLHRIAQEQDLSIIAISHFTKGTGSARDKASGTHAFRDVVRSYLPLAADKETGKRHLTIDKSNYSTKAGSSFEFTLENADVKAHDGTNIRVGIVQDFQESDTSVDQVINRGIESEDAAEERLDAEGFILGYLQDVGGEAEAREVLKAGRAAGFTDNALKKARSKARRPRIESSRSGFGKGSRVSWIIGADSNLAPIGSPIGSIDSLSGNGEPIAPMGTYGEETVPSSTTKWDPKTMRLASTSDTQGSLEVA